MERGRIIKAGTIDVDVSAEGWTLVYADGWEIETADGSVLDLQTGPAPTAIYGPVDPVADFDAARIAGWSWEELTAHAVPERPRTGTPRRARSECD